MIAYFWIFAKEYNSTQRPDESQAVERQIELKQPTDIVNPAFLLRGDYDTALNYCYVPTLHRYYKINGVRWMNGLWEIGTTVDVLASWRDDIGAQNLYVLRSSNVWDGNILDTTYSSTTDITIKEDSANNNFFAETIDEGIFSVGVASSGGTDYYLFTKNALTDFVNYLFSDAYADAAVPTWSTIFPQIKAELNPLQYITSVMWLPIQNAGANVGDIKVGFVSVPSAGMAMPGLVVWKGGTLNFGNHPQISRGRYLNFSPFAKYDIFVPGFGVIDISAETLTDRNIIYLVGLDMRTGSGTLTLTNGAGNIIGTYHAQLGVPYQLSQIVNRGYGAGQIINSAASIATDTALGNYVGAITSAASAISDVSAAQVPQVRTIGGTGGVDALRGKATTHAYYYNVLSEDLSHRGRPLCQKRTLNTIPGFIMCADADIKIPAFEHEQDQIRALLEEGIIYV